MSAIPSWWHLRAIDVAFATKNRAVLSMLRKQGPALCGSFAAAIWKKKEGFTPSDIDLVTPTLGEALDFICRYSEWHASRKSHFRVYANSLNDFVPNKASTHFRLTSSYFSPLCIFVVADAKTVWVSGGWKIQVFGQVKAAADDLSERDGKERVAAEVEDIETALSVSGEGTTIGSGGAK